MKSFKVYAGENLVEDYLLRLKSSLSTQTPRLDN